MKLIKLWALGTRYVWFIGRIPCNVMQKYNKNIFLLSFSLFFFSLSLNLDLGVSVCSFGFTVTCFCMITFSVVWQNCLIFDRDIPLVPPILYNIVPEHADSPYLNQRQHVLHFIWARSISRLYMQWVYRCYIRCVTVSSGTSHSLNNILYDLSGI